MPRVTFVKKAQKDNPVCKKGESYYWWKFRYGGKHYSLTYPKASQLTQSEFLSQAYELNERLENLSADDFECVDDLKNEIEEIADEFRTLGEECRDKKENMPEGLQEGLQEGDTGTLLEERADACEDVASELENIDIDIDEDELREQARKDIKDAQEAPESPSGVPEVPEAAPDAATGQESPSLTPSDAPAEAPSEDEDEDEIEEKFRELLAEALENAVSEAQAIQYEGE